VLFTLLDQEYAAMVFLPPLIKELRESLEELFAVSDDSNRLVMVLAYLVIAQMSA